MEIYDELVRKYVTGKASDGTALTTTYNSWYDIVCNDNCPENCAQAIPSLRFFVGQLIKKENHLGNGGQGSVYQCIWHGKKAAAKFIPNQKQQLFNKIMEEAPQKLMDPLREKKMRQLFTSQASEFYLARKINDPNVLQMFDFFLQHQNGIDEFVIVSELCDANLNQIEFDMSSFLEYFRQVASAIQAIGDQNLSHGDVKPENILLKRESATGSFSVRLADFGLAGIVGGTPLFMAPEVLTKSIPYFSDIYSLGISILITIYDLQLAFRLFLIPG